MTESEKGKNGRKKTKTHDTRSKNGNKENEYQGHTLELKNTYIQENRVQKALTGSSSLNTSWADDTEATYGKGGNLCQSNTTENTSLPSGERSEDLMVDRIEGSGINPDNVMSDFGSGDSEGTIETDLETLRIEDEKINKLTEEKKKQDTPIRQWEMNGDKKKLENTQVEKQEVTMDNMNKEIAQEQDQVIQYENTQVDMQNSVKIIQDNLTKDQKKSDKLETVSKNQNQDLVKEITAKEVKKIIGSFACNKAPGVDGLSYKFYKRMKVVVTPVLRTLFNKALKNSKIQESWGKSIIFFISKELCVLSRNSSKDKILSNIYGL
ncbi:40446_t:CDS:2, partial [Gigaspora margarita]